MMTASDTHTIEVVRDDSIFLRLKDEWSALWAQCPEATEAQAWAWQRLYCSLIARLQPLLAVTARDSRGVLVALGTFSIRRDRGTLLRQLCFLGEHDVDYHGILHRENVSPALGHQMLKAACDAAGQGVSVIELTNMPENSWTAKALCAEGNGDFGGAITTRRSETFAIPLPATMDEYWATFSKKTRDRLKGKMRKLQREMPTEFRAHLDTRDLALLLDEVEAVDRSRWGAATKFGDDGSRTFLREMIGALMEEKLCRIFTLHVNGRCAAYIVGFVLRGALRIPYLAHDLSIPGNHSIGLINNIFAIEHCIQEGFREYDLTRGSEGYKALLGGEVRHNLHAIVYRGRATEALAGFNRKMVAPLLRNEVTRKLRRMVRG